MTGRAALVGLLGVIVLIAGSAAWLTVGPGAGAPTGACASLTASAIESPLATTDAPLVAWTASDLPGDLAAGDEQVINDVAAFGNRLVAVGRNTDGPDTHAFVLHSIDGLVWEGAPDDATRFAGVELTSLLVTGSRLYGIGSASTDDRGGSRVAVWVSDDGRSWREAAGPFGAAYASSLSGDSSGLLMVGGDTGGRGPMAWRSTDGQTWDVEPMELPVPASAAHFNALAATDEGWIAAGSISTGADAPAAPVVWRSTDGASWSCHLLDDGGFSRATALALHRSGERWLIVGSASHGCGFGGSCAGYPIAWSSADGAIWGEAISEPEPVHLGGTAYDGAAAGFVGVHGGTWLSQDGRAWTRVSDGETSGAIGGQVDAIDVSDDGRVVVAGVAYDRNSDGRAWIAVGELRIGDE